MFEALILQFVNNNDKVIQVPESPAIILPFVSGKTMHLRKVILIYIKLILLIVDEKECKKTNTAFFKQVFTVVRYIKPVDSSDIIGILDSILKRATQYRRIAKSDNKTHLYSFISNYVRDFTYSKHREAHILECSSN